MIKKPPVKKKVKPTTKKILTRTKKFNKKIRPQGSRPRYSLKQKVKKNKTHNKFITKQNKIVSVSNIKPNSLSYVLWKAERNAVQVKKTRFKHEEIFAV